MCTLIFYVLIKQSSFGAIPHIRIALQEYLIPWQLPQSSLFDQHRLCTLLQDKESNRSRLYLCSLAHTGITSSLCTFMAGPHNNSNLTIFNVHVLQQSGEVWQYHYSYKKTNHRATKSHNHQNCPKPYPWQLIPRDIKQNTTKVTLLSQTEVRCLNRPVMVHGHNFSRSHHEFSVGADNKPNATLQVNPLPTKPFLRTGQD